MSSWRELRIWKPFSFPFSTRERFGLNYSPTIFDYSWCNQFTVFFFHLCSYFEQWEGSSCWGSMGRQDNTWEIDRALHIVAVRTWHSGQMTARCWDFIAITALLGKQLWVDQPLVLLQILQSRLKAEHKDAEQVFAQLKSLWPWELWKCTLFWTFLPEFGKTTKGILTFFHQVGWNGWRGKTKAALNLYFLGLCCYNPIAEAEELVKHSDLFLTALSSVMSQVKVPICPVFGESRSAGWFLVLSSGGQKWQNAQRGHLILISSCHKGSILSKWVRSLKPNYS